MRAADGVHRAAAAPARAELAKQVAVGQQPRAREAARGWLGDTAALEPVTRAELHRRMREGGVLVLDVRPAAEYAAGHVAGAVSGVYSAIGSAG